MVSKHRLRDSNVATEPETSRTSDTSRPLTMTDLPTELIWHIASYLATPTLTRNFDIVTVRTRRFDLCALRLVCRSLRDMIHAVFLPTAFQALEIDLTQSHLEALIEISRNSEYAATVRELHFVMAEAWRDPDDESEAHEQEMMERNHVERIDGAILLSMALKGFPTLETIRIKPVMWVSWMHFCNRICSHLIDREIPTPGNSRFIQSRWPHGEGSTTSLMTIVLRALRLSDTRIETLSCSRQLTSKDELNGQTGCRINHFNTSFYPMNAFQHLQTLDLVVALRPSKRCTYLKDSHRLCILTLLSRSIYGDSVYNLLARTETAYVTLHSIR